jgi:hypothetical protein
MQINSFVTEGVISSGTTHQTCTRRHADRISAGASRRSNMFSILVIINMNISSENVKGRDSLVDLGGYGIILLKYILKE